MSNSNINLILIHYGEIGLKGKNQPTFRKQLKKNIKLMLKALDWAWPVTETRGYLTISVPENWDNEVKTVYARVWDIAVIVWYTPCLWISYEDLKVTGNSFDVSFLEKRIIDMANLEFIEGKTFCVRSKRTDKNFPSSSMELEKNIGAAIIKNSKWNKVNLNNPDQTFFLNIQKGSVFIFCKKMAGCGGLPVGTVGNVLTLLSGGIDSPVAAYLAARRGCRVNYIHFTATKMQQQEAKEYKISKIVRDLSRFTLRSQLYLVPYIYFDMAMFGKRVDYQLIIFRRFMARVAEKLAEEICAESLITGDNLAQVASQTLPNIVSTSKAVSIPILRPLLTYDKEEIIDIAKKIDTYQQSIEPYKDCCAIISKHPKTISKHEILSSIESDIFGDQYNSLIEKTLNDKIRLDFKLGEYLGE